MELNTFRYWWESTEGKAHEDVFALCRQLQKSQAFIRDSHVHSLRLYGNLNTLELSIHTAGLQSINAKSDRLAYNIVRSCVDTVTQKITKNRPRPMFLTEGGDWDLQEKGKLLNQFVDGQFESTGIYHLKNGPMVFRDSAVFGSGFLKIYRQENEIKVERIVPFEVFVDENEGKYGSPRSMFQVKNVPKSYLAKLYPEFKSQIKSAPLAQDSIPGHKNLNEMIQVIEGWHLPSCKDAGDGRHVIIIETCTLVDEEYKKDYFPIIKIDWNPRLQGYMGQGLSEQLTGIQIEINRILRDIQLNMHLHKPKLLVEHGSKIVKSQLDNSIGSIVYYSGIKPEWYAPPSVSDQTLMHLEGLRQRAFEEVGVSQLSAQSTKPAGLNSGKALREYDDIETERFILIGQAWEQFFLDAAKIMIDIAKDIAEETGDYWVLTKDRFKLNKIKWSDIDLKEDQYQMKAYPTSMLSKTPAGKLQDAMDLIQAGFMTKEQALKLLDYPDTEEMYNQVLSQYESFEYGINQIVKSGKFLRPRPTDDLTLGIKMYTQALNRAVREGVSDSKIDLIEQWISEAQLMVEAAQMAQMQQQMAMQPQAQPMAPANLMGGGQ